MRPWYFHPWDIIGWIVLTVGALVVLNGLVHLLTFSARRIFAVALSFRDRKIAPAVGQTWRCGSDGSSSTITSISSGEFPRVRFGDYLFADSVHIVEFDDWRRKNIAYLEKDVEPNQPV